MQEERGFKQCFPPLTTSSQGLKKKSKSATEAKQVALVCRNVTWMVEKTVWWGTWVKEKTRDKIATVQEFNSGTM